MNLLGTAALNAAVIIVTPFGRPNRFFMGEGADQNETHRFDQKKERYIGKSLILSESES